MGKHDREDYENKNQVVIDQRQYAGKKFNFNTNVGGG